MKSEERDSSIWCEHIPVIVTTDSFDDVEFVPSVNEALQ